MYNRPDWFRLLGFGKILTIFLDGCHKKGSRSGHVGKSTGLR